jgi:hypothetical protein
MARRRWLLWIATVVVVGGCGPSGGGLPGTGPGGEDLDRLRQQARDALARYDQAVGDAGGSQGFVPAQPLGERAVLEVRQGLPAPLTITA